VEIPKASGGMRTLGVPTVADRVAQMVVKMYLEPEVEPKFHPDSYGYRPNKSALDAVAQATKRCHHTWWVIDLDIKGFLDQSAYYTPVHELIKNNR
jgi:retron-type reverse transcriptase